MGWFKIYGLLYLIEAHKNHETSQSHIDIMITLFCIMVTFFRLAASLLFPTNHFCPNPSGLSSRSGGIAYSIYCLIRIVMTVRWPDSKVT